MAFRSGNRNADVASLGTLLGRIYALKDLTMELGNGIVNIPAEILEKANIHPAKLKTDPENTIRESPTIMKWVEEELSSCEEETRKTLELKLDKTGTFLVKTLLLKGALSDITMTRKRYSA